MSKENLPKKDDKKELASTNELAELEKELIEVDPNIFKGVQKLKEGN